MRVRPVLILGLLAALLSVRFWLVEMPGRTFRGPLPPAPHLERLRESLRYHVQALAGEIGPRSLDNPDGLAAAALYIETELEQLGYAPRRHPVSIGSREVFNIDVEIRGAVVPDEIIIVGAHYDTTIDQPGADDNGSGIAALLTLARTFREEVPPRTLRFVAFVNEEPPWFQGEYMGSLVYAKACRERGDDVRAMWSLETMGYFTDEKGSQSYPNKLLSLFYPDRGNFIAFVGNVASRRLVHESIGAFRAHAAFPSEGAVLPTGVPGVGWSDHWSFWQLGYPGVMITDTALFRYPHYHTAQDTPDRLDYGKLARVVDGLAAALRRLCLLAPR